MAVLVLVCTWVNQVFVISTGLMAAVDVLQHAAGEDSVNIQQSSQLRIAEAYCPWGLVRENRTPWATPTQAV